MHNPNKRVGQALRSYVANGNALVLTGGLMDIEFLNRYFSLNLEPADGNYAPGPFRLIPTMSGYNADQRAMLNAGPSVLPQKGIAVTAVKRESLPDGATVVFASPKNAAVFSIKFCMAENPKSEPAAPLPPVRVYPKYCAASAAAGRPCSCGNIAFLGYNYRDRYPSRWDDALKIMERVASVPPVEATDPANYHPGGAPVSKGEADAARLGDAQAGELAEQRYVEKWPEAGTLVENPNGGAFRARAAAALRRVGARRAEALAAGTAGHTRRGAHGDGRREDRRGGSRQRGRDHGARRTRGGADDGKAGRRSADKCGAICQLRLLVTNIQDQ